MLASGPVIVLVSEPVLVLVSKLEPVSPLSVSELVVELLLVLRDASNIEINVSPHADVRAGLNGGSGADTGANAGVKADVALLLCSIHRTPVGSCCES